MKFIQSYQSDPSDDTHVGLGFSACWLQGIEHDGDGDPESDPEKLIIAGYQ